MKLSWIKETYERVDELEFNRINPYAAPVAWIKAKYPHAVINKTETVVGILKGKNQVLQYPILNLYYDTGQTSPKEGNVCSNQNINQD